jgi:hypothetical protein
MTDAKKRKTMQILEQLHLVTVYGKPAVHPFVVIEMVDLSVAHGKELSCILCYGVSPAHYQLPASASVTRSLSHFSGVFCVLRFAAR